MAEKITLFSRESGFSIRHLKKADGIANII
jgi:hypothetical protein